MHVTCEIDPLKYVSNWMLSQHVRLIAHQLCFKRSLQPLILQILANCNVNLFNVFEWRWWAISKKHNWQFIDSVNKKRKMTWFKQSMIPYWHYFLCHSQLIQIANRKEIFFFAEISHCKRMNVTMGRQLNGKNEKSNATRMLNDSILASMGIVCGDNLSCAYFVGLMGRAPYWFHI